MKLDTLIISAFLAIGVAMANKWHKKQVDHDEVQPFAQREPMTTSESVAIMFKPQLHVLNGCNPYPAVNDAGETSGGLSSSGPPRSECEGSSLGSQIYARSRPFNGFWAIMYMWYFPKTSKSRHGFRTVVVFIDNPELEKPTIVGCSLTDHNTKSGFASHAPCPADRINGHSIKIKYEQIGKKDDHTVSLTDVAGTFQDLVMWDQMPDFARRALNSSVFDGINVDINDWRFDDNIKSAWSFGDEYEHTF